MEEKFGYVCHRSWIDHVTRCALSTLALLMKNFAHYGAFFKPLNFKHPFFIFLDSLYLLVDIIHPFHITRYVM